MQADARLIQDVERVDKRGSEGRGEMSSLDLPSGKGSRLAVQGQIPQPDLFETGKAGAYLTEKRLRDFQLEAGKERPSKKERASRMLIA